MAIEKSIRRQGRSISTPDARRPTPRSANPRVIPRGAPDDAPENADIRGTSMKQKCSTGGLLGLAVAKTDVVRQLCGDAVVAVL